MSRSRAWILILLLTLTACGGDDDDTASPSTTVATTIPLPSTTLDPVAQGISDWWNTHHPTVEAVEDSFAAMQRLGRDDLGALAAACQELHFASVDAAALPPVPEAQIERYWRAALEHTSLGANACYAGASTNTPADLDQAEDWFTLAASELDAAVFYLERYA